MEKENEERTLVLTELDKQTHATVCVRVRWTQYNVCVEEQVSSFLPATALHQCWHYEKGKYLVIE